MIAAESQTDTNSGKGNHFFLGKASLAPGSRPDTWDEKPIGDQLTHMLLPFDPIAALRFPLWPSLHLSFESAALTVEEQEEGSSAPSWRWRDLRQFPGAPAKPGYGSKRFPYKLHL